MNFYYEKNLSKTLKRKTSIRTYTGPTPWQTMSVTCVWSVQRTLNRIFIPVVKYEAMKLKCICAI